jgi:hypothetical protein
VGALTTVSTAASKLRSSLSSHTVFCVGPSPARSIPRTCSRPVSSVGFTAGLTCFVPGPATPTFLTQSITNTTRFAASVTTTRTASLVTATTGRLPRRTTRATVRRVLVPRSTVPDGGTIAGNSWNVCKKRTQPFPLQGLQSIDVSVSVGACRKCTCSVSCSAPTSAPSV